MQLTEQLRHRWDVAKVNRRQCFSWLSRIIAFSMVLLVNGLGATRLYAQAGAGAALRFGSSNALVQVAHNTNFNGYPFTVSTWLRTTNGTSIVQGIASKYLDNSGNGWTLVVQNGKLRGFHYRSFGNYSIDATSVATVSDGYWHHAALMVDASGGKIGRAHV